MKILQVIGRKNAYELLTILRTRGSRFNELRRELKITPKSLSALLIELQDCKVVTTFKITHPQLRKSKSDYIYVLTPYGLRVYDSIHSWRTKNETNKN